MKETLRRETKHTSVSMGPARRNRPNVTSIALGAAAIFVLSSHGNAATYLQDNFSGDSGSIISGTSTMVFNPQVGSGSVGATIDNAQITPNLGVGGSAGLQYFDTGAGNSGFHYTPTVALTNGPAHVSFDILGHAGNLGPIDPSRPFIDVFLYSGGNVFGVAYVYYNSLLGVSDGSTFHGYNLGGTEVTDTFYHVDVALNLSASTMRMSLVGPNISTTTAVNSVALNWNPSLGLTAVGFFTGNTAWGYNNDPNPPIYNTGAYAVLDNVLLEIPEPGTVALVGLGAAVVGLRRRRN